MDHVRLAGIGGVAGRGDMVRVLACTMFSFCTRINASLLRMGALEVACSKLAFWSSLMGAKMLDKASRAFGRRISMSLWTDRHMN